jgi:hypothetical protein
MSSGRQKKNRKSEAMIKKRVAFSPLGVVSAGKDRKIARKVMGGEFASYRPMLQ